MEFEEVFLLEDICFLVVDLLMIFIFSFGRLFGFLVSGDFFGDFFFLIIFVSLLGGFLFLGWRGCLFFFLRKNKDFLEVIVIVCF